MISFILSIVWFVGFIYYTERIVKDKEGIAEIYDGLIQEHPEILIYFSTKFIISLIYILSLYVCLYYGLLFHYINCLIK